MLLLYVFISSHRRPSTYQCRLPHLFWCIRSILHTCRLPAGRSFSFSYVSLRRFHSLCFILFFLKRDGKDAFFFSIANGAIVAIGAYCGYFSLMCLTCFPMLGGIHVTVRFASMYLPP